MYISQGAPCCLMYMWIAHSCANRTTADELPYVLKLKWQACAPGRERRRKLVADLIPCPYPSIKLAAQYPTVGTGPKGKHTAGIGAPHALEQPCFLPSLITHDMFRRPCSEVMFRRPVPLTAVICGSPSLIFSPSLLGLMPRSDSCTPLGSRIAVP